MNHPTTLTKSMRQLLLAGAVLACAVPLTMAVAGPMNWLGGSKVQGSGKMQKQARALAHFTGINLNVPGDLELHLGNTEGVTIETDDNVLPLIESVVEDGVLMIRPIRNHANLHTRFMKIVVTAKNIDRLALAGSGSISADPLKAAKLQFDVSGSGEMNLKGIDADTVAINLSGSGDLSSGAGRANNLSVSIAGSGDVDLGKVQSASASVSVVGSGDATVWANAALSVTLAGSGDVNYYGDPKVSKSVVGSGDVSRIAGTPK